METDLSLLEIEEVDDSLLEITTSSTNYIPNLDLDSTATIDFACSPLQISRSEHSIKHSRFQNPGILKDKDENQNPCYSSPKDLNSTNKDNLNDHSIGSRSPSEDPQHVKRRKKRGGYNLRKSLAWNKAFLTEEGVLDPSELSRLNHSLNRPNSPFLGSVTEDGSMSGRKSPKISMNSLGLQSIEEDLFDELPENSSNEGLKITDDSLNMIKSPGRRNAARTPQASRKVQPTKPPFRSMSHGGGCPRPTGLSSQKRLPCSSTLNGTLKDSKLPRRTVQRPDSSSVSTTSRNTVVSAKTLKCNKKVQPGSSSTKSVGQKESSTVTRKGLGSTSSSFKPSVLRSSKTTSTLTKEKRLTTDPRPLQAAKGRKLGPKITTSSVPCGDEHTTDGESAGELANSVSHDDRHFAEDVSNSQCQPAKPTGLRMPSPSLRYFDQPKSSASQGIQSLDTQSSSRRDSCIPKPRKLSQPNHSGEAKPLHAPLGTVKVTKGSINGRALGDSSLVSALKPLIPPTVVSGSHPTKSEIQVKNLRVKAKGPNCKNSYNETNQIQSLSVHDDADDQGGKQNGAKNHAEDRVDKILHSVNQRLESSDNLSRLSTRSPEQLNKANHFENEQAAIAQAHDEVEHILHYSDMGLILDDNPSPPRSCFTEQIQKEKSLEKLEDASNDAEDDAKNEIQQVQQDIHLQNINGNIKNENLSGSESDNLDIPLRLNSQMQVSVVVENDNVIDDSHAEKKPLGSECSDMFIDTCDIISDLQVGYDNSNSGACTSVKCSSVAQSVNGKSDIVELRHLGLDEVDEILHNENTEVPVSENIMVEKSEPLEDPSKDNGLRITFINPKSGCEMDTCDVESSVASRMQLKEDCSGADNMIKVQQIEDPQFEHLDSSLQVIDSVCGVEFRDVMNEGYPHCCSRIDEIFVKEQAKEQLNVRKPCPNECEEVLPKGENKLDSNDGTSLHQRISSDEYQKNNKIAESSREVLLKSDDHEVAEITDNVNLCESYDTPHAKASDGVDEDKNKHLQVEGSPLECLEISSTVESHQTESPCKSPGTYKFEHSIQNTDEFESFLKLSKAQSVSDVAICRLEEDSCSNSVEITRETPNVIGVNESKNYISPEKTLTNTSVDDATDGENQSEPENGVPRTASEGAEVPNRRNSVEEPKDRGALAVKLQLKVAPPFSDEWLAALEAAGEDILTMKTGAVQNSPPDKSVPEPGPWSPVKRKHQEIGPFDCTKCTNLPPPPNLSP